MRRAFLPKLDGKQTKDVLANNHEDEVDQPYNPRTEENTDDSRYDLAVLYTRNDTADPCRDRYDCENYAYNVRKTKVIALCHSSISFLYLIV